MNSKCRRFEGKIALVTGAANGFGRATVHRLVDEGLDTVFIVDREVDGAQEELEKVEAAGGKGYVVETDVSSIESVEAMGQEVASRTDRLDVLVNCAGIGGGGLGQVEADFLSSWDNVMNINLRGTLIVIQALLPLIKVNGGAIINISSDGGHRGRTGALVYDASKAAVAKTSRNMACDLVRYGIRVNDVAPGWAATEFHFGDAPDPEAKRKELEELEVDTNPMKRLALPHEIAAGIAYLASDDASFVTGSTLFIDGGRVGNDPPKW